jgi:drug/metabolite transporter (DMT)-like permease
MFGVVLISQLVGMALAAVLAVIRGEGVPAPSDIALSLVAGSLGGVGISALYRGLAEGRMGIVAPVTGILAAVLPVIAGIVFEGWPSGLVLVGIALALVAVVLVSRVPDESGGRQGLGLALLAGTTIGLFGVLVSRITDGHVFAPLVIIRAAEAVLIVGIIVVTRDAWRPRRSLVPALAGVGLLDMTGNAAYILAIQTGALAVASVVSSLYPITTVVLAAVVLKERVTRSHALGIVLAGIAIALIGIGSA